jgi:hypothetical protein
MAILVSPSARAYEVILKADGKVDSCSHKSTSVEMADQGCARFTFWIDPFVKAGIESLGWRA